jgi:hypothetical protein
MSIVLQGSTSGSITLQEPAVAGTTVLTLPAVTGTVLTTTSPKAGNVIQVVSGSTSTQTSSSSSTFADISLSASITPSSSSSKILVIVALMGVGKETNNTAAQTRLVRDSTTLLTATLTGFTGSTAANRGQSVSYCYLDSPATTSSTTYKIQLASWNNNAVAYVNDYTGTNPLSTITLMEIAA